MINVKIRAKKVNLCFWSILPRYWGKMDRVFGHDGPSFFSSFEALKHYFYTYNLKIHFFTNIWCMLWRNMYWFLRSLVNLINFCRNEIFFKNLIFFHNFSIVKALRKILWWINVRNLYMKRRNLKAYSPVPNNSAGTLIIVLWQIFQQAILFSSKKYKKKNLAL